MQICYHIVMTRIIIGANKEGRDSLLLKQVAELLGKEFYTLIELLKSPDIHYLTTSDNSIGIEEVKKFSKGMMFRPFEERYQIGIIDSAEYLTTEAQNSLLKTLEESKDDTVFFLLVKSEKSLLETVLSRGSKFYAASFEKEVAYEVVDPFLDLEIVEKLSFVEKIGKEKEREEIILFLNALLSNYKIKFEKDISQGKRNQRIENNITRVQQAIQGIRENGNKKLVLYNMVVQMGE